jgi:cytochrome d ubiquinol oxidase subunit I
VPTSRLFLICTALSGVVAVVCLEAGWVVTEVGRQPWTVVGLLLTRNAVATEGNLWPFFAAALAIYLAVATGALLVLRSLTRRWRDGDDDLAEIPYGPPERPFTDAHAGDDT